MLWWKSPAELRLTDAAELMADDPGASHAANIADLVNSSTELFFKSGTLRYAVVGKVGGAVGRNPDLSKSTWNFATPLFARFFA